MDADVLSDLNPGTAAKAQPAAVSGAIDADVLQALNPGQKASAGLSGARRTPIEVPESPKHADLSYMGLARGAADVAGGLAETATGGALGFAGQLAGGAASYAGRLLPGGDWERAQRWADATQKAVSTAGGAYEGPLTETGKAIQGVFDWLGQKYGAVTSGAGQKTLEATGSPALAATVDATLQALPQLAAAKIAQRMAARTPAQEAAPAPVAALAPDSIVKMPAAVGQAVAGGMSGAEVADAVQKMMPSAEVPAAPMAQAADHAPSALPTEMQADRAAVLSRVGHQNVRQSALAGDGPATMFDFDAAKAPDPKTGGANPMRVQIDSETAANAAFAGKILEQTGGSKGLDQATLYDRGSTIDSARTALQQWHENQVKTQYAAARDALGDTPVKLDSFADIAPDPAKVSGTTQGIAFKSQLDRVMQSLGIMDEKGNVLSTSVNNAERLRQWLNQSWKPETSGFISELKGALDSDVTKAAGKDVFEQARAARTLQAQTLDHPAFNKMAALADAQNFEAIPGAIEKLPSDQLAHVVNVLQNMPEGLQPAGTAALREIAGHYANKIADAGTPDAVGGAWKNIRVSDYLDANNARLAQVFTPDGMRMISDLNQAGKITAMDKRYIGAAAQGANLAQRGLIFALPKAGAALGGALGAPFGAGGAAAGAVMGGQAAGSVAEGLRAALARRQIQSRIQPLRPGAVPAAQP